MFLSLIWISFWNIWVYDYILAAIRKDVCYGDQAELCDGL